MRKRVFEGLILGAVLLAAIIAFWIILEEPVGRAHQIPNKLPKPTFTTSTPMPKPTTTTTTTSTTTTSSPSPTPSPSPSPSEEPSPPPFTYELIEADYCQLLRNALTARRPDLSPYCTGSYDRETGDWNFMLGFTWTFPN